VRRVIVIGGAAVVVAALVLNVLGVLPYPGGPLREDNADGPLWLDARPADQGNNSVGSTPDADWALTNKDFAVGSMMLENPWPFAATIESIEPVAPSDGLQVSGTFVRRPDVPIDDGIIGFVHDPQDLRTLVDSQYAPLPALIAPGGPRRDFVIVVRSPKAGPAGFDAVAVTYRVGPFSFRVVHHQGLKLCLGETAATRNCPDDEAE
jgi:hypothetical protein